MNKLTKAGLAGGLGALLLLGGTTFALWTDSASVAGGTITSGNLEVAAGTVAWHDVSADVTGTPTSMARLRAATLLPRSRWPPTGSCPATPSRAPSA